MNTLKSLRKILGKLLLFAGVIFELILLFVRSYDPNTENYSDVFGNIVHSPDFFLGRLLSPIINLFSFHGLLFVGGILVLYVGYRLISAEEKVNTIHTTKILTLVLIPLLTPMIVSAAWWNPLSWFDRPANNLVPEEIQQQINKDDDLIENTSNENKIKELEKTITSLRKELALLKSKTPEVKEVIKEIKIPEEKIVYVNRCEPERSTGTNNTQSYGKNQCTSQKKSLLPKVENAYENWWEDKQDAKMGVIQECKSQNYSTLECDHMLSDHNVEWQNKITEIMRNYQNQLTSCSPNERRFGDISNVISSSY